MNNVALNSNEIDLVFNNCECININICAIENLQFEVESEQFMWDKHHKNLMKQYKLKDFYLKVNCSVKCNNREMKINSFSDMRILIDQLRTEYKLLDD